MKQPSAVIERAVNSPGQVLFASMIGTTIEFFDFYIYATAAVLVFPRLFFPPSDPASAMLASLATFAIAFLARPIGSALFGHFGDRVGRKTTLVADNGANWLLSIAPDRRIQGLDSLSRVKGSDFEVVIPTGPGEGPRRPR